MKLIDYGSMTLVPEVEVAYHSSSFYSCLFALTLVDRFVVKAAAAIQCPSYCSPQMQKANDLRVSGVIKQLLTGNDVWMLAHVLLVLCFRPAIPLRWEPRQGLYPKWPGDEGDRLLWYPGEKGVSEFEKLSMFDQTGKVLGESNVPDAGGALSDGSMGWSFDKYVEAAIASDKTPALQTRLELQENSGLRCAVSAQKSIKERLHKRRWDVHL